jgi:hypothetical protein
MTLTTPAQLPQRLRKGIRNKVKIDFTTVDAFKFYKDKLKKDRPKEVNQVMYCSVIRDFNKAIMETIIMGDSFYFPFGLGDLSVRKKKVKFYINNGKLWNKGTPIDYPKTMDYWKNNSEAFEKKKLIFNLNDHTDGYKYRFHWDKTTISTDWVKPYDFKPTRLVFRKLATILHNEEFLQTYQTLEK